MQATNYKRFVSTVHSAMLPPIGVDTHAHISCHYFGHAIPDVLYRAEQNCVRTILSICLTSEAYHDASLLYGYDAIDIYTAVGIHPCDTVKDITHYKAQLHLLLEEDDRIKAIGETGLDYHWTDIPYDMQYSSFIEHITLAKKYAKPLMLHTRKAEEDVFSILCKEGMQQYPVIWHCYGGDAELARRIVDMGWYISFAGNITYPNAQSIREALHAVPFSQLLIETDSPYLAPQVQRGSKNEPAYLMYIAEVIAHERDVDIEKVWTWTSENALRVLNIV